MGAKRIAAGFLWGNQKKIERMGAKRIAVVFFMGKREENRTSGSEEDCSCVFDGET
jgi:hypothetical protein